LFSCKKEGERYCWTCWSEIKGVNYNSSFSIDICEMTADEIITLEDVNTKTIGGTTWSLRCQRKNQ
jgi:hypothetical protein